MKKDNGRFTLRFDPADPQQQAAIKILNAAGRRKAILIAQALHYYIALGNGNTDTSVIHHNSNILSGLTPPQTQQGTAPAIPPTSQSSVASVPIVTSVESAPKTVMQGDIAGNEDVPPLDESHCDDVFCSDVLSAMSMFEG